MFFTLFFSILFVVIFNFLLPVLSFTYENITSRHNLARDVFMLSFCLWGTNAIDLYECTDLKNGRLTYNRAKTKDRRDIPFIRMLNHVDEKMKITDIYVRKSWKPLDEANRKLLDFVFEK